MSEELKPCPKCGPDGAPLRCIGEMYEYRVECVECHTVQTPCFKTLKEAEAYWNAFAEGMTQQAARIAELEKENREQLIDYENRLCEARKYQQDAVRRCEELEAERDRFREVAEKLVWLYSDEYSEKRDSGLRINGFYSHEWLGMILDMARKALEGA